MNLRSASSSSSSSSSSSNNSSSSSSSSSSSNNSSTSSNSSSSNSSSSNSSSNNFSALTPALIPALIPDPIHTSISIDSLTSNTRECKHKHKENDHKHTHTHTHKHKHRHHKTNVLSNYSLRSKDFNELNLNHESTDNGIDINFILNQNNFVNYSGANTNVNVSDLMNTTDTTDMVDMVDTMSTTDTMSTMSTMSTTNTTNTTNTTDTMSTMEENRDFFENLIGEHFSIEQKMNNLLKTEGHLSNVGNAGNGNIGNEDTKLLLQRYNNLLSKSNGTAFIYVRTSKRQNENTVSIEVQQIELLKFCFEQQFNVYNIYIDDGKSAKNMKNQTNLYKLKRDITKNNSENKYFLIFDISRFSRNSLDALSLLSHLSLFENIHIYFLTEKLSYDNSYNKHAIRTHLSNSQFLSEYSSERVKSAIALKRLKGEHIGSTPFGFKLDLNKRLIVDEKEFTCIKYVNKLYNTFNSLKSQTSANTRKYVLENIRKKYTFRGKTFNIGHIKLCILRLKDIQDFKKKL